MKSPEESGTMEGMDGKKRKEEALAPPPAAAVAVDDADGAERRRLIAAKMRELVRVRAEKRYMIEREETLIREIEALFGLG